MAYIKNISSIAVAAIVFMALSTSAQDATTIKPVMPEVKLSCINAESIAFESSQIIGDWYEVARYPASTESVSCVKVNIAAIANTSNVAVDVTYADDNKQLWLNKTVTANVSVPDANKPTVAGYNISFSIDNTSWPIRTYKLLATDYKNYAIACSNTYTNGTNNVTEFGVVLTRLRMLNSTALSQYGAIVSANFTNFLNGTMSAITQSAECLGRNGAVSTLPFLSAIMAAIYALLMLVN